MESSWRQNNATHGFNCAPVTPGYVFEELCARVPGTAAFVRPWRSRSGPVVYAIWYYDPGTDAAQLGFVGPDPNLPRHFPFGANVEPDVHT